MPDILNAAKEKKIRILSGPAPVVEELINDMFNDWVAIQWNYSVVKDQLIITVLCLSASEARKQQLATLQPTPPMRH